MKAAPPAPNIQQSIRLNRLGIEAVLNEGLAYALNCACLDPRTSGKPLGRIDEVSVLIHFFSFLPDLEAILNSILRPSGVGVGLKGVFCHKSGTLGPVVDFDVPPGHPGCELADLLILVTHRDRVSGAPLGNASFLQAKVERAKFSQGSSSKRQSELYCQADSFRFRDQVDLPGLPVHLPAGFRYMPGPNTSGFVFWSYDAQSFAPPWHWAWGHSSAIAVPESIGDKTADLGFGSAIYRMMEGSFGIGVAPPVSGDLGWNRIVHDVLLRAIREPLGDTKGIAGLDNVKRVSGCDHASLELLMKSGLSVVLNPFRELAEAFESKELLMAAESHAREENRRSPEDLERILALAKETGTPPPPGDEDEIDSEGPGSSGSFLQINLFKV
jgi:hypothetical protein